MNDQNPIKAARPYFPEDDVREIASDMMDILASGRLILGPRLKSFEENFAKYVGTRYALGFSSCTAALEVAMRFFDVANSNVVVPTNTFVACPNSIVFAGGRPSFSDIEPDTYSMSLASAKAKLDNSTRGVMAVHLGGLPVKDIYGIRDMCKEDGLFLIEDCSHAHGASIDGKKVGSIGDAGCFSLIATKIITSGLGGMMTTSNEELYEFAKNLRDSASGKSPSISGMASDWMMSEFSAAIGMRQLHRLDGFLEKRREIAGMYMEQLGEIDGVGFHVPQKNVSQSYYKFLATIDKNIDKNALLAKAKSQGIEMGTLYEIPCHMQPLYNGMGFRPSECPQAEELLRHQIALPMHVGLTEGEIGRVTSFIREETA